MELPPFGQVFIGAATLFPPVPPPPSEAAEATSPLSSEVPEATSPLSSEATEALPPLSSEATPPLSSAAAEATQPLSSEDTAALPPLTSDATEAMLPLSSEEAEDMPPSMEEDTEAMKSLPSEDAEDVSPPLFDDTEAMPPPSTCPPTEASDSSLFGEDDAPKKVDTPVVEIVGHDAYVRTEDVALKDSTNFNLWSEERLEGTRSQIQWHRREAQRLHEEVLMQISLRAHQVRPMSEPEPLPDMAYPMAPAYIHFIGPGEKVRKKPGRKPGQKDQKPRQRPNRPT